MVLPKVPALHKRYRNMLSHTEDRTNSRNFAQVPCCLPSSTHKGFDRDLILRLRILCWNRHKPICSVVFSNTQKLEKCLKHSTARRIPNHQNSARLENILPNER